MSMRSSTVNRLCFDLLTSTATTTSSASSEARAMTSRWPLVTGSNDPGHTQLRTASVSSLICRGVGAQADGATVPKRALAITSRPPGGEPGRPSERPASRGTLHHDGRVAGDPVVVQTLRQDGRDGGVTEGVRRVEED